MVSVYLLNRKQFLTDGDKQTNIESIRCGVPQGSISGPLWFLILVNDLHKSSVKQGNLTQIFTRYFQIHIKAYSQMLKLFTHTPKHRPDPHPR